VDKKVDETININVLYRDRSLKSSSPHFLADVDLQEYKNQLQNRLAPLHSELRVRTTATESLVPAVAMDNVTRKNICYQDRHAFRLTIHDILLYTCRRVAQAIVRRIFRRERQYQQKNEMTGKLHLPIYKWTQEFSGKRQ
jgi:hypothetical protein